MKRPVFRGVSTALITPFAHDRGIDFEQFGEMIDGQIRAGIDALTVCGSTGESASMSAKEKLSVIEYAVWKTNGRVPVIAGTGGCDTRKTVRFTKKAAQLGADAALVVCPYYLRPTQAGIEEHFLHVAEEGGLPLIVYDVPSRTGAEILPETAGRLAEHEQIVGFKDAGGSLTRALRLRSLCGDRLPLYAGDDALILPYLSLGAEGVISVVSALLPHTIGGLCRAWFAGEVEQAREVQIRLEPLISALFREPNPIGVKGALEAVGFPEQYLRRPLTEADAETKREFADLIAPWFESEHGGE